MNFSKLYRRSTLFELSLFVFIFFISSSSQVRIHPPNVAYSVRTTSPTFGTFNISDFSNWVLTSTNDFPDLGALFGIAIHPFTQDFYVIASTDNSAARRLYKISATTLETSLVLNTIFIYATQLTFPCNIDDTIIVQSRKSVWAVNVNTGSLKYHTQISFYDTCPNGDSPYALCYRPNDGLFVRALDSACNGNYQVSYYNITSDDLSQEWTTPLSSSSLSLYWNDCFFSDEQNSLVIRHDSYFGLPTSSEMPRDQISTLSGWLGTATPTQSCCPENCNRRGMCLSSRVCECDAGFDGPYCSIVLPPSATTTMEDFTTGIDVTTQNEGLTTGNGVSITTDDSSSSLITTSESASGSTNESAPEDSTTGNMIVPVTTSEVTSESLPGTNFPLSGELPIQSKNIAAIVGPVIGIVVVMSIIAVCVLFIVKRKKDKKSDDDSNYGALPVRSRPSSSQSYRNGSSVGSSGIERYSSSLDPQDIEAIFGNGFTKNEDFRQSSPMSVIISTEGAGSLSDYNQPSWVVPYYEISFDKEIGRGSFGIVYKGKWKTETVAVKQIKTNTMSRDDKNALINEMKILMNLPAHPNIITLVGICIKPLSVLTEYQERGNLFDYLHSEGVIPEIMLYNTILGVARGMQHLHNQGICHRDLTSRNVLLSSYLHPKITDFGLSRVTSKPINMSKTNPGTIRSLAPEVINSQIYTTKSDVWSFGILICEVYSRKIPYHNIHQDPTVAAKVSTGELTCEIPMNAPPFIQVIAQNCLLFMISQRPTFDLIVDSLERNKL